MEETERFFAHANAVGDFWSFLLFAGLVFCLFYALVYAIGAAAGWTFNAARRAAQRLTGRKAT